MQVDDSSLAPVHRRFESASGWGQPVVPAVRKPFSNNNKKTFDGIKFNVYFLIGKPRFH